MYSKHWAWFIPRAHLAELQRYQSIVLVSRTVFPLRPNTAQYNIPQSPHFICLGPYMRRTHGDCISFNCLARRMLILLPFRAVLQEGPSKKSVPEVLHEEPQPRHVLFGLQGFGCRHWGFKVEGFGDLRSVV